MLLQFSILLLGVGASILAALFGIGGGVFYTTTLNFILCIDLPHAISTASSGIFVGTLVSWIIYHRRRIVDYGLVIPLSAGRLITSAIGAYLVIVAPKSLIYLILSIVLLYSSYKLFKNRGEESRSGKKVNLSRNEMIIIFFLGIVVGIISPLIGIGGGVIAVPILVAFLNIDSKIATASHSAVIAISYFIVILTHWILGNLIAEYCIPLVIGVVIGAISGTFIHKRSSSPTLSKLLGILILIMGLWTVYSGLTPYLNI